MTAVRIIAVRSTVLGQKYYRIWRVLFYYWYLLAVKIYLSNAHQTIYISYLDMRRPKGYGFLSRFGLKTG